MDTQTQIDRLIELAIIQRTELKQLVEQLPQLREHLNSEVEKVFDEVEPQLRVELEEWAEKKASDSTAKLGNALEAKIAQIAADLQVTTQARFDVLKEQERKLEQLRSEARSELSAQVAILPETVKEIVGAELARFPRAGEIDQLRKEFAEPRGLNPRGKWQAGETYNRLDLVTYNGDSFVSNIDGNTEKPSRNAANWTLNAARGAYGGGGGITSLNDVLNAPTSGQIIGSQNGQYVPKTLVAGANITINETASSITIIGDEGQISLQDGTAAAPSLFFTSDTDTGLYRPAANTLGVAVGGAQIAYFDANGITTVGAGATFDGSVHAANGNANNPSLSFTSDDNTGFFRHQPDEIGISLGGTQTGTLTAALATLTSKLLVSSGATTTAATDLLVNPAVKASGNLLDLQVASSSKFSVSSAGSGTFGGNLTVSGGTIGTAASTNLTLSAGSAGAASIVLGQGSSGNIKTSVSISNTTPLFTFIGGPQSTDGQKTRIGIGCGGFSGFESSTPAIAAVQVGTVNYSGLAFEYYNGARTEGFRLNTTGNLLIGTTTDGGQKLQVAGDTAMTGNLTVSGTGTSTINGPLKAVLTPGGGHINLANSIENIYIEVQAWSGSPNIYAGSRIQGGSISGGIFRFLSSNDGAIGSQNFTEKMRLLGNGNLLIGTISDGGQKLQVNGTAIVSSTAASTSTTTGALVVSGGVGVAGAVNVGGAIAIGNTVQTAASVASTHKVTISIGGVTYYLLATNV